MFEKINTLATKLYVRATENRGQTMAEYALIIAGIAVVAYAAYDLVGKNIQALVSNVATDL
jgi:Flp pilus assembly pilin Flp